MANIIVSGGRVLTGQKSFRKYVRNPEYLDLPALSDGDQKIVMLAKIYPNGNYFRFQASGNYKMNFGDGQGDSTATAGSFLDKQVDYANIPNSSLTSGGYKQTIITLEPQAGQNLTAFKYGTLLHPDDAESTSANIGIVDIKMASPNITDLTQSFYNNRGLEQFEYVGTCNVTNLSQAFYLSYNLQKVVGIDTSNVTNFYRCFRQCDKLLEVPKFDLSSATSVEQMFYNCYNIEYIEPYDLDNDAPNITSIYVMFFGCSRLLNCPITSCANILNFGSLFVNNKWGGDFNLDCSSATNVINMFQNCHNLISCNATFPNNLTNTSYMFDSCTNLEEVKVFDCSNVTNSSFMFRNTYRLDDLSAFDFSSSTNSAYMFISSGLRKSPAQLGTGIHPYFAQSCSQIKKWGNFNGTPPTSQTRTFLNNSSLEELPNIVINTTTTTFTTSLENMRSLVKIPSWDCSNITSAGNWFQDSYSLQEVGVYDITVGHSYRNCNLVRTEIVNIFNNLGTASGTQTINVSGNPGSSDLTTADELIAQNKGWTVTS